MKAAATAGSLKLGSKPLARIPRLPPHTSVTYIWAGNLLTKTAIRQQTVEFILRGKLEGLEITPKSIGLHLFNQFNSEVEDLIVGSQKPLKPTEAKVHVEEGSYKLKVALTSALLASFVPDLHRLAREDSLGEIDPERAKVIQRWQARAKAQGGLHYEVRSSGDSPVKVRVTDATDYHVGKTTPWVAVEQLKSL